MKELSYFDALAFSQDIYGTLIPDFKKVEEMSQQTQNQQPSN